MLYSQMQQQQRDMFELKTQLASAMEAIEKLRADLDAEKRKTLRLELQCEALREHGRQHSLEAACFLQGTQRDGADQTPKRHRSGTEPPISPSVLQAPDLAQLASQQLKLHGHQRSVHANAAGLLQRDAAQAGSLLLAVSTAATRSGQKAKQLGRRANLATEDQEELQDMLNS